MSTHNLCFRTKIRKNVYSCKPQFNYIKVGCKGVFITRTCFRDVVFRRKGIEFNFILVLKKQALLTLHVCTHH